MSLALSLLLPVYRISFISDERQEGTDKLISVIFPSKVGTVFIVS